MGAIVDVTVIGDFMGDTVDGGAGAFEIDCTGDPGAILPDGIAVPEFLIFITSCESTAYDIK